MALKEEGLNLVAVITTTCMMQSDTKHIWGEG